MTTVSSWFNTLAYGTSVRIAPATMLKCSTTMLRRNPTMPKRRLILQFLLAAATFSALIATPAPADSGDAIDVGVRIQDVAVFVDVDSHVRATPQESWVVMTNYDHATAFISKLEESVILSRTIDTLLV